MINYLEIVSKYYPETICETYGLVNDYNSIVWKTTPIDKEILDNLYLEDIKNERIKKLSNETEQLIISGFQSNALGTVQYYDSELEDQINLIGAATTQTDTYYATREGTPTAPKTFKLHTSQQLQQVLSDGKNIKVAYLQNFIYKRELIYQATTVEEVLSISL